MTTSIKNFAGVTYKGYFSIDDLLTDTKTEIVKDLGAKNTGDLMFLLNDGGVVIKKVDHNSNFVFIKYHSSRK